MCFSAPNFTANIKMQQISELSEFCHHFLHKIDNAANFKNSPKFKNATNFKFRWMCHFIPTFLQLFLLLSYFYPSFFLIFAVLVFFLLFHVAVLDTLVMSLHCLFSRNEFDEDRVPDLEAEVYQQDIHSISSLVKMYFRELPNPLLTYQLYDKFAVRIHFLLL